MRHWFFVSLALALCVFLASPLAAQPEKGRWGPAVWSGGATVGPVASTLSGDLILSDETRWGPIVGAWLQYWATDNLAVSFEVNYVQKGATNVITARADTVTNLALGYLEFPIVVRGALGLGSGFELSGHLGVAAGINTSTSSQVNGIGVPLPDTLRVLQQTEFTFPVGAGLAYYLNDRRSVFALDMRYSLGITDVFAETGIKSQAWELLIRYGVRFGHGD
jgi:hypothetical protein